MMNKMTVIQLPFRRMKQQNSHYHMFISMCHFDAVNNPNPQTHFEHFARVWSVVHAVVSWLIWLVIWRSF